MPVGTTPPRELLDEPISAEPEDDLGRAPYAKALARLLHDMPSGSSARFGVYGEWGEGKTSVMKLMASELERLGDVPVFFTPWTARSREEAWDLLLAAIRRANNTLQIRYRLARRSGLIGHAILKTAAKFSKGAEAASTLLGDQLADLAADWSAAERKTVIQQTVQNLGDSKLVVLVDDLDRTDPALLRNLLMSLRDLFNLPNFFYVLGISPTVIAEGLAAEGVSSSENGERFLEKIVEYPTYLPEVKPEGIKRLIARAMAYAPDALRQEPLTEVNDLLPTNPRRLKLFLRHMTSLRSLLTRFDDEELDWASLYVAQLLRLEFPTATRSLVGNPGILSDLNSRHFTELASTHSGRSVPAPVPRPEEAYAPKSQDSRERFLKLCNALADRSWDRGRYDLLTLLTLFESPPEFTWREANIFVSEAHQSQDRSRIKARLWEWVDGDSKEDRSAYVSRLRAAFTILIEMRDAQLDHAIDVDNIEQMGEGIASAATSLQLLRLMIERSSDEPDALNAQSFLQFLGHVRKWATFFRDDLFADARKLERDALADWRDRLRPEFSIQVLPHISHPAEHRRPVATEFRNLELSVRDKLANQSAALLVEGFAVPGRVDSYRGQPWNWRGKALFFDRNSAFHSPSCRARLNELASLAPENADVQENFLAYMRLWLYGVFEPSEGISQSDGKELLGDLSFLQLVWEAALSRRLNARMAGSLRVLRNRMLKDGLTEAAMPLPKWWESLEETFFKPSETEGTDAE